MAADSEAFAIKNFSTLIGTLEEGKLNSDISARLEDAVRELQERLDRQVKGKVTIDVKINLVADRGVIEVTGDYKVKMPPESRHRTLMFVHAGRFLSRQDERQGNLELKAVSDSSTKPIRVAE